MKKVHIQNAMFNHSWIHHHVLSLSLSFDPLNLDDDARLVKITLLYEICLIVSPKNQLTSQESVLHMACVSECN